MVDWPQIIREHGPLVWRTAYRLLGNEADANDCYQETFIAAVRQTKRQAVTNWPGLLVRITTQRAIDVIRKSARHRRHRDVLASIDPGGGSAADPSEAYDRREQVQRLREALAQLPADQATIVSLYYFCDWSHEQIAEHVGSGNGAVRTRLHRIRERLRQLMETDANPVDVRVAT